MKTYSIKIGNRNIGNDFPVFVIAEAGVNHNGDVNMAMKLIDVAALSGADAVKFQTFEPKELVTKNAAKAGYQVKNEKREKESQYEMLERLKLKKEDHLRLKTYAEGKGLIFLSTPFSLSDAEFLKKLGIKAIKVGSSDANNIPYLEDIAKWKLPIILSIGMSDLDEVKESVRTIRKTGNEKIIVLQCTTNYPTPFNEVNLRVIPSLQKLGVIVGYSDHTMGIEASVAAVALGAKVIEKHFTLDRNLPGPDQCVSLNPEELTLLVSSIRNVELSLGCEEKVLSKSEKKILETVRKSLVAKCDIQKGEKFTAENVMIKRPGTGLLPKYFKMILGKTASKNIAGDTVLKQQMIG